MTFTHPPLPSSDGLRILTLSPGDFWDPLEATLESVPFSKKPKYIALSYTWANPDDDHAKISAALDATPAAPPPPPDPSGAATAPPPPPAPPQLVLGPSGQHLPLLHNAALALRFLRSPTHPLPLWLDAVCIDQGSIPERNAQVALMGFIFTRAAAVIGWLGMPDMTTEFVLETLAEGIRRLRSKLTAVWEAGLARKIAARFAGGVSGPAEDDLFKFAHPLVAPDAERTHPVWCAVSSSGAVVPPQLQANRYWGRLWVVQEVCLPRNLAFVLGGEVWPEAAVRQMLTRADRVSGRVVPARQTGMQRLLAARQDRFTDAMRLEALVERFLDSGCADTRDRVFGLVGLSNDVDTFALAGPGAQGSRGLLPGPSTEKRGRALLEIDYKRSFYNIWRDVVSYMYYRAKPRLDFGKGVEEMEDERRVRLVRFAGVVQKAFDGRVEDELRGGGDSKDPNRVMLKAKGYVAGTVVHLGPSYSDFVGSYREQQLWIGSWDMHYEAIADLEKLRQMEERYSAKVIDYSDTDVSRICGINSAEAVAWSILQEEPPSPPSPTLPGPPGTPPPHSDPVRFLGTDLCLGIAPPEVRQGDLIIRFWNCDAAIIVRRKPPTSEDASGEYYELVGRADVAEPYQRRGDVGDSQAKDAMRVIGGDWPGRKSKADETKAVYVRVDFETLQKMSAAITI